MQSNFIIKFMMKMLSTIFLLGLLIKGLALTAPLNTCPAFVVQWGTIASLPMGNNFSATITTTVTLSTAQPDTNFQAAVGYKAFKMPQFSGEILVDFWVSSVTTSQLTIFARGPNSGIYLQMLKFVVLVVPSDYNTYVYIFRPTACMVSCTFDYPLSSAASIPITRAFPTISAGTYKFVGFINSINIKPAGTITDAVGLSLSIAIINATHYNIIFKNISPNPILLAGYRVTVIAFRDPSRIFGVLITALGTSTVSDTSISPTNTFFGLSYYGFSNADFQFDITISGNTVIKSGSPYLLGIGIMLISFQTGQCCANTPFMDDTNSTCIDVCPVRMYSTYYPAIITTGCQKCLYDCKTCNNSISCTSCDSTTDFRQLNPLTLRCKPMIGYYQTGSAVALPCNYPHCCGYTPVIYIQGTSCLVACPTGFALNSTTSQCFVCNPGYWSVSGLCTDVIGCVSTLIKNNRVQCIFCRLSDHFILQNQTCICTEGYMLDRTSGKCVEVCGDGIHFSQKCDDNNTEDGDGCSSTCQLQDYFKCESNSSYIPSQCAYIGAVQLNFNYANKTEGKNQAVFSFGFSTKRIKLNAAKIVSSFVFTCDPRVNLVTMSASSTEVLLYVDYEEDLQGKLGTVTFTLNSNKVLSNTSLSTKFAMIAQKKLVAVHVYPIIVNLKKAIQIIVLSTLVVFTVASFSYRIIAIELLESILLVYIVCLQNSNLTEPLMVFKNLRILALNFRDAGNYYSQGSIFQYSFQNESITKSVLALLLLVVILVLAIQKIIRQCIIDDKNKQSTRIRNILKIFKYIFKSFIYSISIGFGFQVLFPSFMVDNRSYQNTCIVLFLSSCFSFLFFEELTANLRQRNDCQVNKLLKKRSYTVVYLFFWLTLMIMLSANNIHANGYLQQMLLTFFLLFFLWFIYELPYNSALQNAGQIFNLVTDILFLSWSTGRKYSLAFTDQYTEVYFSIAIVSLMYVSILFTILRVIQFIYYKRQFLIDNLTIQSKSKIQLKETMIVPRSKNIKDAFENVGRYMKKSIGLKEQSLNVDSTINHNVYLLQKEKNGQNMDNNT